MDIPGMGGYRCFQQLLRIAPKINVIVASGYSSEVLPRDLLDKGAWSVLPKPFTADSLLRQARDVLDKTRGQSDSPVSRER